MKDYSDIACWLEKKSMKAAHDGDERSKGIAALPVTKYMTAKRRGTKDRRRPNRIPHPMKSTAGMSWVLGAGLSIVHTGGDEATVLLAVDD
jgi:hypothetical protein